MVHHRQRLSLRLEPGDHLLGVHAQLDDLEGNPPLDRFPLLGGPDRAEAAFADPLQQLVAAERLAHGFVGGAGGFELDGGPERFGLSGQQSLGLLVRGEQGFEALAQDQISGARPVQKGGAFRNRPLARLADDPLFSRVGRNHGNRSRNGNLSLPY